YPLIENALVNLAQTGGFSAVYLPTESNILSNRGDIEREVIKRKYPVREIKKVDWNTEPTPYPFTQVFEVWKAPTTRETATTTVLNSNGAYQAEQYLQKHPLIEAAISFVVGLSFANAVSSAFHLHSPVWMVISAFGVAYVAFKPWINHIFHVSQIIFDR